jgi:Raf kinase inhibitor-like YbhB/YbcL family protein
MLEILPTAIGRVLRGARPGLTELVFNDDELAEAADTIAIISPAFAEDGPLPVRFTADGEGVSPALQWSGIPEAAVELALLIEDADSPTPSPLVQAIVWRLPPGDGGLEEGAMPHSADQPTTPAMGVNSFLRIGYLPPDPPPGHGVHRYAFELFALRAPLTIDTDAPGRAELVATLRAYAIAKGMLIGTYERE